MITKLAVFTPFFSSIFISKSWTDRKYQALSSLCSWKKELKERKRWLPLSRFGYFPWFNPDEPAVVIDINRLSLFYCTLLLQKDHRIDCNGKASTSSIRKDRRIDGKGMSHMSRRLSQ